MTEQQKRRIAEIAADVRRLTDDIVDLQMRVGETDSDAIDPVYLAMSKAAEAAETLAQDAA
jgi:hypothetical protein